MHPSIQKAREVLARTSEHYENERRARERQRRDEAAVIEPPLRSAAPDELIYKTFDNNAPAPQPQQSATMSPEQQAPWDQWARSIVHEEMHEFAESARKFVASVDRDFDEDIKRIRALESDREATQKTISELRGEIAALRIMIKSLGKANVA